MNRFALALLALSLLLPTLAAAQEQAVVTGEGWEAFRGVEYQGGDSRFPSKVIGALLLTDSTIQLLVRRTPSSATYDSVIFTVSLRSVREVSSSTRTRSPGVGRRILWGTLANDRTEEFFALAYDTESTAEAPVFKTPPTQAGALEAKVKFRLRRLGVELERTP